MSRKEDLHELVKGLISVIEEYKEGSDSSDGEEEIIKECKEEIKLLKKFQDEFEDMYVWSFGKIGEKCDKDELATRWSVRHPELPGLFFPRFVDNEMTTMVMLMQVIPHWKDFQKQAKK